MFSNVSRALKTIAGFAFFNGGLLAIPGKIVRMYRREGVAGFRRLYRAAYSGDAVSRPGPNRPRDRDDYAFEVPFRYVVRQPQVNCCAVIHVFYPDMAGLIRKYLENVPTGLDVYISTTSEEKKASIAAQFAGYGKGRVELRVFHNRGRDIAPKLVGFADVYERYDYVLSLHTKKSPHGGDMLAPWRDYLYEHLLGSPEIVKSIFELLRHDGVGMVFPQHFFPLRNHLKWGENYDRTRALLARMGTDLRDDVFLELPSGSMFWARTEALRPLLDLQLGFDDFDEEQGQIDGTLAHAVERAFLYALEGAGYTWAKVVLPHLYPLPQTIIPVNSPETIQSEFSRVHRLMLARPYRRSGA
ncbi:rhamnan synthesis F family protein [Bordetella bronchialis]|uniref:Rhamnan synthesis protein F n=1 Tax=Bordetella bronchialis TaxID=463025 RepID=A0A193G464_9BORD|nr:rhamnan synthesis F family protein [Bordetella bronchialis]ANN69088.1 hypothetical protein BAU06_24760 [Bordetella bronchialis]ANN74236.1 hypothetical protein BAU08_25335 [Bordetella bronchialis]